MLDPYLLSAAALAGLLDGEPPYRSRQVHRWLARGVTDPAAMTDLPAALRARLSEHLPSAPTVVRQASADGGLTRKLLLALDDGEAIESVLLCYPAGPIRAMGRATVCVSTQAGCAMGCPFCATGQAGLRRQLRTDEVVAQIVAAQRLLRARAGVAAGVPDHVTNVVFMGMGEPLANSAVTLATLRWLTAGDGFNLSARAVTVSTIGLIPGIRRLQREQLAITLAISLHAPDDQLRDQLVPVNRQFPLAALLAACDEYVAATRRRITFEYVLIDGINAAPEQARQLADLLAPRLAHVNLIPLNPTPAVPWVAPSLSAQRRFAALLTDAGLTATIRHNRGTGIEAACGQLYAQYQANSGAALPSASSSVSGRHPGGASSSVSGRHPGGASSSVSGRQPS